MEVVYRGWSETSQTQSVSQILRKCLVCFSLVKTHTNWKDLRNFVINVSCQIVFSIIEKKDLLLLLLSSLLD